MSGDEDLDEDLDVDEYGDEVEDQDKEDGIQRPFGSFPKIHPFWYCHPSHIEPSHMAWLSFGSFQLATSIAVVSWKWTRLSIADIPNYLRQQTSVIW